MPSNTNGTVPPPTVFSRVTIVAPRTRVDLALPSDIPVANLLPMLLSMVGEASPDGGAAHGGWCLARLGGEAIDPDRSLSSLGVVDGDLLQIRRRNDNPPAPLFDDVVDAIAEANPDSFRPWTQATARTLGMVAGGLALLAGAIVALRAGFVPGPGHAVTAGALAGLAAVAALIAGVMIGRIYEDTGTGVLVAAGSLPLGFVSGLCLVPGTPGAAHLLLASTLVLVLAGCAAMMLGAGITPFIASATAATLGGLAALVAIVVERPAPGIAAGAAAVALAGISALPRLTIQLSKLPMPQVPGSVRDLKEDPGFADYAAIQRRAGLAHEYLTGLIIGSSAAAAIGAIGASREGLLGIVLAGVVSAVLLLRARSYANGSQAIALLASGMVAIAGVLAEL
ncbi:MAG TPA: type VII secretion integral membrane protein EccD, partial [Pseudonocardiaceae bacterium]|nr:type VII secretion integral membrane protein EccD [Pseudonocardiaceae bacterium]